MHVQKRQLSCHKYLIHNGHISVTELLSNLFENFIFITITLKEEIDRPENKMGRGETTMKSDAATLLSLSNVENASSTSENLITKTSSGKNFYDIRKDFYNQFSYLFLL